jgi:hypothetical protein
MNNEDDKFKVIRGKFANHPKNSPTTPEACLTRLEAYVFPPMTSPALDILAMDLVVAWQASGSSLGSLLQGIGAQWKAVEDLKNGEG